MQKLIKYITSLAEKYGGTITHSNTTSSVYLTIGDATLRISDHLPHKTHSKFSIIKAAQFVPDDLYLLMSHSQRKVAILDYEKVKEVVRTFCYLSSIFIDFTPAGSSDPELLEENRKLQEEVGRLKEKDSNLAKRCKELQQEYIRKGDGYVLGIPISQFNDGQMHTIKCMCAKVVNRSGPSLIETET